MNSFNENCAESIIDSIGKEEQIEDIKMFVTSVKISLEEFYSDSANIKSSVITKNNDVSLTGITVIKNEINISPTIYMEGYYSRYKDGECYSDLISEMISIFEKSRVNENFDITVFTDFDKARKSIVYKLVNKDKNKTLLKDVPHYDYLDMAIVFYTIIDDKDIGKGSILVKNAHLEMWKHTKEEIFEIAKVNTPKLLKYSIKNLQEVLSRILFDKFKNKYCNENYDDEMIIDIVNEMLGDNLLGSPVSMYVLSNENNLYGAACMLYDNVLHDFADELNSNLIILPSSVHEVIIVPENEIVDSERLSQMVKEVNRTQVAEEEILSDSVYIFKKDICKIVKL